MPDGPVPNDLPARLRGLMLRDERRLGRRLDGLRAVRDKAARAAAHAKIDDDIARAEARVVRRTTGVPAISYPPALPVSQAKDELLAAIRDHQVVIVAGETGSGKTTQLPKICLELGRGVRGLIGHTQPRRLAARTVAERIAEELDIPLGSAVGWKVRFTDQVGDDTLVKVMTDGILLAEIQQDRQLLRYDTLIIDEAHERSLNVDFILGYLKQLLPGRPDLKVVITSATIDPERFAQHFDGAPIVAVSGRTYPVEVRYRPVVDPDDEKADPDRDQTEAILDAVDELSTEGSGDILVFLSGEREIRDTAEALRGRQLPGTEILPLFARLSAAEQRRVFQSHPGRRIVLATNVAETSLTVPGIRYVVDPGTARISRYSHRTKVQRLPIEAVSQASAHQRNGRCGRTSDGICIRLYTEADFEKRPEFTDPEILRTNLASVILQMTALGIGDLTVFPFLDPPDRRNVAAGVQLLEELAALDPTESDPAKRLTAIGRQLAQLPVDPRLARMIVAADGNGCLHEVLVIAAGLSIVDPRERPTEHQQASDAMHARFADPTSDFLSYLALWSYLAEQQQELSGNRFRKLCKSEFLHYLRVREWQDLYTQLRQVAKTLGLRMSSAPEDERNIHAALVSGLLSHVGVREGARDYLGARSTRFAIFPGSALAKKPPQWVVAGELVETSRLWARTVARVDPVDVERQAAHLVLRIYSEPRWDARRGAVMATEKVTLYGVPLVVGRAVNYGSIDPAVSRELFIRHALVEGEWSTQHPFFAHNRRLLEQVGDLEDRARRRDIRIDDEALFDLYDERVGAEVVSARHFDSWWKAARRSEPELLTFDPAMLMNAAAAGAVDYGGYPDTWEQGGLRLPLSYAFQPGAREDGVTVHVPLVMADRLPIDAFGWTVPGLRTELVTALLRSLRKDVRRSFVPVADYVEAVVPRLGDGPLLDSLERELHQLTGVTVPRQAWRLDRVPEHLRPTFRIVDDADKVVAEGKDLADLRARVAPRLRAELSAATADVERTGLLDWPGGDLARSMQITAAGRRTTVYPALVDEGGSVAVRVVQTPAGQRTAMGSGVRRLLLLTVPSPLRAVVRSLPSAVKLGLQFNPHGGVPALLEDCVDCALDELIANAGGPPWDEAGFRTVQREARARLTGLTTEIVTRVEPVLGAAREVDQGLPGSRGLPPEVVADISTQLTGLVHPGFVAATGRAQLRELPRYLRGILHRLDKLPGNVARDDVAMRRVHAVQAEYDQLPAGTPEVRRIRWMIEELRISLFAQSIGTAGPVSERRIYRAMDELPS
ncbi:MAG: ATP-dependent RNA helicase HrpA [Geodermatophilaceae bacterium]